MARPRLDLLPGYTRLPGTSRRFGTPTGETLSRRQYENLARGETQYQRDNRRAQQAGWSSYSEYRRAAHRYAPKWDKWKDRLSASGIPNSKLGPLSPLQHAAIMVEAERARLPPNALGQRSDRDSTLLTAPDGPLAQLLVAMGHRSSGDTWNVGDTPTGHKR